MKDGTNETPAPRLRLLPPPPILGERLLRPEEVAKHLGISRSLVYDLLAKRQLPYVQVRGMKRVRPSDLKAYEERNTVRAEC